VRSSGRAEVRCHALELLQGDAQILNDVTGNLARRRQVLRRFEALVLEPEQP
jgi:hypothetical protein